MSKILFFCEGDEQNEKSLDWQYVYAMEHFDYESIYDSTNTQFPDLVALRELIISLSNE
jgi:hypothetical protein